jgi:hypothetical protein
MLMKRPVFTARFGVVCRWEGYQYWFNITILYELDLKIGSMLVGVGLPLLAHCLAAIFTNSAHLMLLQIKTGRLYYI